jgi:hypothetical protein
MRRYESNAAENRRGLAGRRTRNLIGTVKEADILNFVRTSIGSVWALEMLVLVGGRPERAWQRDELVRELRSSPAAIMGAARLLERAGLLAMVGKHGCRYRPASPELDHIGELVRKIYAAKPATVIGAIFELPDDKLHTFAAAFKFKE